jgi:hypothetical protein
VHDLIEHWGGPAEVDAAVQETMRECAGPTDEVAVMNPDVSAVKH